MCIVVHVLPSVCVTVTVQCASALLPTFVKLYLFFGFQLSFILYVVAVLMAHRYPYIRSLVNTLNSVTRPGSFANGGMFQLPLPALKINGVDGVVRFPASDAQAKAIIAVCLQAPYGRGEETIVDTSVRNTWQLDPTHFTIMNPEWNSAVKSLAAVVGRELGCNPSLNVCCELHKFLLYEQGSFFKVFRMYCMIA